MINYPNIKNLLKNMIPILNDDIKQMIEWLKYMNSSDTSHLLPKFKQEQIRLDSLEKRVFYRHISRVYNMVQKYLGLKHMFMVK